MNFRLESVIVRPGRSRTFGQRAQGSGAHTRITHSRLTTPTSIGGGIFVLRTWIIDRQDKLRDRPPERDSLSVRDKVPECAGYPRAPCLPTADLPRARREPAIPGLLVCQT